MNLENVETSDMNGTKKTARAANIKRAQSILRAFRDQQPLGQRTNTAIAKKVGIHRDTVGSILGGDIALVRAETMSKIERIGAPSKTASPDDLDAIGRRIGKRFPELRKKQKPRGTKRLANDLRELPSLEPKAFKSGRNGARRSRASNGRLRYLPVARAAIHLAAILEKVHPNQRDAVLKLANIIKENV